jgi:hypothetical protein
MLEKQRKLDDHPDSACSSLLGWLILAESVIH